MDFAARLQDAFNWVGTRLAGADIALSDVLASRWDFGDTVYRMVKMRLGLASLGAVVALGAVGNAQCPDYTTFSEVRVQRRCRGILS